MTSALPTRSSRSLYHFRFRYRVQDALLSAICDRWQSTSSSLLCVPFLRHYSNCHYAAHKWHWLVQCQSGDCVSTLAVKRTSSTLLLYGSTTVAAGRSSCSQAESTATSTGGLSISCQRRTRKLPAKIPALLI